MDTESVEAAIAEEMKMTKTVTAPFLITFFAYGQYEDSGTDEPGDFLWTRLQFKVNRLGTAAHVMYRQAPSGLSFVMVPNTWTRLSLEEMVVGSAALVLASSVDATFVSIVLFTRDSHGPVHLHALRYHDFFAEVGVRSFGCNLLDDVRGPGCKSVEKALMHVGSAVLGAAMTTLAAPLFLLP